MKLKNYKYRFCISLFVAIITTATFIFSIGHVNSNYSGVWNNTKLLNESINVTVTCETPKPNDFLREKYNAGSTSFFIFSFIFPLCFFIADIKSRTKPTRLSRYPFLSFFIFLNYLFHFIGTFTNHACSCLLGLQLDNMFLWSSLTVPIFITFVVNMPKIALMSKLKFYSIFFGIYIINAITSVILSLLNLPIIAQTIITVVWLSILIITNIVFIIYSCKNKKISGDNKKNTDFFWAALVLSLFGLAFAGLDGVYQE